MRIDCHHLLTLCGVILLSGVLNSRAASGNWNVNASGNWSTATNWTPAVVPGTASGDVVGLTYNITGPCTVTIDTTSLTVGTLKIGDSGTAFYPYTLAASGGAGLTFTNKGSTAILMQATTTAADSISAPLTLAANLSVSNNSSLTLSGIISAGVAGKGITKTGPGTLTLSGANTYSGGTTISKGALVGVVGSGCSNSAVSVAPASGSAATLGVSVTDNTKQWACSSLTVSSTGSSLDFNFGSVAPSATVAPLKIAGAATFTTTPTVTVECSNLGPIGTQYPLMTWSSTSGTAPANVTLTGGTGAAHLVVSGSTLYLVLDSLVILTPVPGYSTLNIAITIAGTVSYDGYSIPINSTASQAAHLAGTQPLGLTANFSSGTQQGTVTGLDFVNGNIEVTNTLSWTLNLGTYLGIINLGTVNATGSGILSQIYTPHPMSLVSGGTNFALANQELILDGGTLSASATGAAASFLTPFSSNLAANPIQMPIASSGNGTVTLSSPTVVGSTASYTVTVTLPANSSYLLQTSPANVTIAITGTTRWQGTLTRLLSATPATNLAIMATGPTSFKLSGLGGAGQTYSIYSSTNLAAPMTNWWLIGTTNADAGGVIQFLDVQATNQQRFYRFAQ